MPDSRPGTAPPVPGPASPGPFVIGAAGADLPAAAGLSGRDAPSPSPAAAGAAGAGPGAASPAAGAVGSLSRRISRARGPRARGARIVGTLPTTTGLTGSRVGASASDLADDSPGPCRIYARTR